MKEGGNSTIRESATEKDWQITRTTKPDYKDDRKQVLQSTLKVSMGDCMDLLESRKSTSCDMEQA